MAATDAQPHWTAGAPKWAAVIVLGAASTAAIGWSIGRDAGPWRASLSAQARSIIPAPTPIQSPTTPQSTSPQAAPAHTGKPTAKDRLAEPAPTPPTPTAAPSIRTLVNVNTADQAELELLPGIGPALAKRIIEYRATKGAFARVEDLDNVKGIGPKILERLRKQVAVE